MSKLRWLILVTLAVVLSHNIAWADDARPAYLEIKSIDNTSYSVVWKRPELSGRALALSPVFPETCETQKAFQERSIENVRYVEMVLQCSAKGLSGKSIYIEGIEKSLREVVVRVILDEREATYILKASNPSLSIDENFSPKNVVAGYISMGISHILNGIDHLFFVLALIFLVANLKSLVKAITAFTISHSLTLIGTVMGWFYLPVPFVEALIALSIFFLAIEMTRKRVGKNSLTIAKPWLPAFGFGLVHGFGFASAITIVGLPSSDIAIALLSFNVGVEIGQLIFVIPTYLFISWIRNWKWAWMFEKGASYIIGSVAFFWMLTRLASF